VAATVRAGRRPHHSAITPALAATALAAAALVGALATTRAASAAAEAEPVPAAELGAFLYGRDCAGCHAPDGRGSWRGPSLEGTGEAGNHYVLATGRMPITSPHDAVERSEPAYGADEIDAIVGHVTTLVDGPELPQLFDDEVDLAHGGYLYRLHCGVCHSSTGIGTALAFDDFAPPVLDAEPLEVAAVMAAGTGAMPAFYPNVFTDDELASIVAYVQQLREPEDRGIPFGRAGRVDEALAAWGVGIVSLLLLAGWIARAPAR
jgi:ubiquinol-cytochrome c reductase cytochrome c subunit